ncbi:MAG: helix-turn-helix domain-containing protein, partial [Pseudomonadota bacterium]
MDPGRPPFPPKRYLLQRMGISEATLKKHIKELELAGFIKRQQQVTDAGDYGSNIYHLDGLIEKLKKLVPDFNKEREEREESRQNSEKPNARRNTAAKARK